MAQTALIVAVPEAAPLVDHWRMRCTPDAPLGVPAHITVLFPFLSSEQIERERADIAAIFATTPSFDFSLASVRRFPELVYLAPEPAESFVAMTRRVVERYPEHQPYEGQFTVDEIVPHLTVAEGDLALQNEVEEGLRTSLPIAARADEVVLIEEREDGTWRTRESFQLT